MDNEEKIRELVKVTEIETKLELDRRHIEHQIYKAQEELKEVVKNRYQNRKSREKNEKIGIVCNKSTTVTMLYDILMGKQQPDSGTIRWGKTISVSYFPQNNNEYFENCDLNLVEWLSQFGEGNDVYFKAFLGRMLFSGEEVLKKVNVLSGGEKMRCMIAKMMLCNANCLILDTPTNHLDLESIQAFNNNLITYKGNILFASHDHEFIQTVANRIIELTPNGIIDKMMEYDEYISSEHIKEMRARMYGE